MLEKYCSYIKLSFNESQMCKNSDDVWLLTNIKRNLQVTLKIIFIQNLKDIFRNL